MSRRLADFQGHFRHQADRRDGEAALGRRGILQLYRAAGELRQRVTGDELAEQGEEAVAEVVDRGRARGTRGNKDVLAFGLDLETDPFGPGRADVDGDEVHAWAAMSCLSSWATAARSTEGAKTRS